MLNEEQIEGGDVRDEGQECKSLRVTGQNVRQKGERGLYKGGCKKKFMVETEIDGRHTAAAHVRAKKETMYRLRVVSCRKTRRRSIYPKASCRSIEQSQAAGFP